MSGFILTTSATTGYRFERPVTPLEWQDDALCAQSDPEAWFPDKGESPHAAKLLCASCDVRDQCLKFALDNEIHYGVWGGLSYAERRQLRAPISRTARAEEAQEEILRMVRAGRTDRQVAELLGCSETHVSVVRRKAGLPSNWRGVA